MKPYLLIILVCICLISCSDSDDPDHSKGDCDDTMIIDEQSYINTSGDFMTIISAEIMDDCLLINYSASGCSGDNWELSLIGSDAIAESLPEQRYIKLSLENPEACLAIFTKETSFNISLLQIENDGVLILNLEAYDEALRYTY